MSNVSRGCCLSNRCGGWCRTLLCHSVRIALDKEIPCFVMAIIYLIEISLHSSSTGSAFSRIINLAGIVVCVAGIIVTLLGSKSRKKRSVSDKSSLLGQSVA